MKDAVALQIELELGNRCKFGVETFKNTVCLELRQPEVACQCYSSVTISRDLDIILMGIVSSYEACS